MDGAVGACISHLVVDPGADYASQREYSEVVVLVKTLGDVL